LRFLDGAGWHRANNLTVPENMRLEAPPPYSPQLNPVEHIWEDSGRNGSPPHANEAFMSICNQKVAEASRRCKRRLKPAATKNCFLIATLDQLTSFEWSSFSGAEKPQNNIYVSGKNCR